MFSISKAVLLLLFFFSYLQGIDKFIFQYFANIYNWKKSSDDLIIRQSQDSIGRVYFRIGTRETRENNWNLYYLDIELDSLSKQKKILRVDVESLMRIVEVKNSIGAGISIHLLNRDFFRIETIEERLTEPTDFFVPMTLSTKTTPDAHIIRIAIFLNQDVEVEFREPEINITSFENESKSHVSIKEVSRFYTNRLIGFGVEDDGRFYDAYNRNLGVNEKAIRLREIRLNYLRPHWVRTFVWFKDWSPKEDGATFTWGSDGINSLCRTLEYYQRKNIPVNLTCVTWGMKEPWECLEVRVKEIVELLNYLIKEKKFTCIRYFTLTNEPNYFFQSKERFEKFVGYHKILYSKLLKHNLKIRLIGSDDAMGTDWFYKCLYNKDYRNTVNLWASHFYWNHTSIPFAYKLFENRAKLLYEVEGSKRKPFVVTEFGVTDSRFKPPFQNQLMEEFGGALLTVSAIIDGLNSGVQGFNIWCLQEVAYPGGRDSIMRIGLWGFADKNWEVYPIYHALAMFTRNTEPGDNIIPMETSIPESLKAVRIGKILFWAHIGSNELQLSLPNNSNFRFLWIYTGVPEDPKRIMKKRIEILNMPLISIPPMSFGCFFTQ